MGNNDIAREYHDRWQWAKVSGLNDFFCLSQVMTMPFDKEEIYSQARARREGGNNFYPLSNVHQWLNMADEGVLKPTHELDAVPAFTIKGFLTRFAPYELNSLIEREYVVSVPPGSVKEHGQTVTVKSLVTLPAASEIFENFVNDTVKGLEGTYLPELRRAAINRSNLLTRTGANSPSSVVYCNGGIGFARAKNNYKIYPMIRLRDTAGVVQITKDTAGRNYYELAIPETPEDVEWADKLESILGF